MPFDFFHWQLQLQLPDPPFPPASVSPWVLDSTLVIVYIVLVGNFERLKIRKIEREEKTNNIVCRRVHELHVHVHVRQKKRSGENAC